jgi:hypothetical protein
MGRSAYDTIYRWARRTTTSFGELRFAISGYPSEPVDPGDTLVYRLKQWPELPQRHRTAKVYRALSLMSNRPVSRGWFVRHSRMKVSEIDALLDRLVTEGSVEVLDVSRYPNR